MFQTNRNILWTATQSWHTPPVLTSEYIEIVMKADSNWKVYVPVAWSPWLSYPWANAWWNGNYWAPFDWDVYVDNLDPVHISWSSWRQWYREVATVEPDTFHYVKILPHIINPSTWLPNYWRAMAFAMWGSCVASVDLTYKNPIADYLYQVIYDWAQIWYKCSETVIWAWYKTAQFAWCTNLTRPFPETDVSMVTAIWMHFLAWQYCQSWVTESVMESTPDCTAAQTWYREQQYWRCPNLLTAATESDPPRMWQWYYHSYREWQYAFCTSLESAAPENPPSWITWWIEYKFNQYRWCTSLKNIPSLVYAPWYPTTEFRWSQFRDCWNSSNPMRIRIYWDEVIKSVTNSLWLVDANVFRIYVPRALLQAYKDAPERSNISDSKFFSN